MLLCIMTFCHKSLQQCLKYEVAFVVGSLYPYITLAFYFKYCSENDEEITKIDVTLFRKLLISLDQQSFLLWQCRHYQNIQQIIVSTGNVC